LNAFSDAYAVAQVEAKFDEDIRKIDEQLKRETDPATKAGLIESRTAKENNKREVLRPAPFNPAKKKEWQDKAKETEDALATEKAKGSAADKNTIKVLEANLKQQQELANARSDQDFVFLLYKQRYEALRARKKVAVELGAVYDQFSRLANYNASLDVRTKAGDLIGALNGVLSSPLPDISPSSNSLIGRVIGDVIEELVKIQQNKAILKSSARVVIALRNLQKFFDEEKVVYKSIPTIRASFTTQIAKNLVENGSVVSTSLLSDMLGAYELRWPEPQVPFTSKALSKGVQGIIDARSKPLEKASQDTADGLSKAFTKLITLHEELANNQPLSFVEFVESSSAVQLLIEQLQAHDVPAADIFKFLKAVAKENQDD